MNIMLIKNLERQLSAPLQVKYCDSFFCRMRGFMFSANVEYQKGILLVQSQDNIIDSTIHMFFVFTSLAVNWINSDLVVVDRVLAQSWRPIYIPRSPARYILEIHPDRFEDFRIGEHIELVNE